MASSLNPGGGVEEGAGAQEENLFRRSNYKLHLEDNDFVEYPIPDYGGIYSPNVKVFRDCESKKYALLNEPFEINFIAASACFRPQLTKERKLKEDYEKLTIEKIKTIYSLAAYFKNECVVLSAFGCGAFCNPPIHIAELFKNVLEKYFSNVFRFVVFAIIEDHNSKNVNLAGNVAAFETVFNTKSLSFENDIEKIYNDIF